MSSIVAHFERFPMCVHLDGNKATPDFTVVFNDDIGLAVEISNLSLYESSVDKLCKQLLRYDGLEALPGATGSSSNVDNVDVLCLLPSSLGNAPLDRILGERYLMEGNFYSPRKPPIIAQFSRDVDKYSFWRSRDPRNGIVSVPLLNTFIDGGYGAPGDYWTPYKAKNPFMNDNPPPLYLACFIWLKVLPTIFGGQGEFDTTVDEVVSHLRSLYNWGTAKAVREALNLLQRANFVRAGEQRDEFRIRRSRRMTEGDDFAQLLAERACQPAIKPTRTRRRIQASGRASSGHVTEGQISLFDPR